MTFLKQILRSFTKLFKVKKKSSRKKSTQKVKSKLKLKKSTKAKSKNKTLAAKKTVLSAGKPSLGVIVKDRQSSFQLASPKISKAVLKPKKPVKSEILQKVPKPVLIGQITHYFPRISVIVLKVTGEVIHVGDEVHIQGQSTDFVQKVNSLQIESVDVKSAKKGQLVGLKVKQQANPGDKVFNPNFVQRTKFARRAD